MDRHALQLNSNVIWLCLWCFFSITMQLLFVGAIVFNILPSLSSSSVQPYVISWLGLRVLNFLFCFTIAEYVECFLVSRDRDFWAYPIEILPFLSRRYRSTMWIVHFCFFVVVVDGFCAKYTPDASQTKIKLLNMQSNAVPCQSTLREREKKIEKKTPPRRTDTKVPLAPM